MPTLKDIRRRIDSVGKTQQITRAMRMVAGAKLRRSQQAIEAARPYADRMRDTLSEVARAQKDAAHPLLAAREEVRTVEFVVVSSDRGLCGAFNANVIKHAQRVLAERDGMELDAALRHEWEYGQQVFASEDSKEGPKAFAQKRKPEFKGR